MSIETIASIGASVAAAPASAATPATAASTVDFDSVLANLGELNSHLLANQDAVAGLALGKTDNLHQVMMGMEQTRLEFELALAVRNKVLEAYQELMRMQV